jgi:Flp pilus assembly protein TadG
MYIHMVRLGCRAPRRGQSIVELALALPIIMFLTVGVADLGRAFFYAEAVNNAARQALRVAVHKAQQSTGDTVCNGVSGSASSTTTLPPASGATLFTIGNQAAMESTFSGSPASTAISGATLAVTWHCAANKAITNGAATTTDPTDTGSAAIEVQLTYRMTILTPFLATFLNSPVSISTDIVGRAQY